MVRILVEDLFTPEGSRYIEAAGLSTDDKPEDSIVTGSKFTEVDTGDEYRFNEAGDTGSKWVKSNPGGGGGGGGGSALIVTITYDNDSYWSWHRMDKTVGEIKSALESGMQVVCIYPGDGAYLSNVVTNVAGVATNIDSGSKEVIGYTVWVPGISTNMDTYHSESLDGYATFMPD